MMATWGGEWMDRWVGTWAGEWIRRLRKYWWADELALPPCLLRRRRYCRQWVAWQRMLSQNRVSCAWDGWAAYLTSPSTSGLISSWNPPHGPTSSRLGNHPLASPLLQTWLPACGTFKKRSLMKEHYIIESMPYKGLLVLSIFWFPNVLWGDVCFPCNILCHHRSKSRESNNQWQKLLKWNWAKINFFPYKSMFPSYFIREMAVQVTQTAFLFFLPFMDSPVVEGYHGMRVFVNLSILLGYE